MAYLENHTVFESTSLEELRDVIARISVPHEIDVKSGDGLLNAKIAVAHFGDLDLAHVSYGDVDVDVKSPEEENDGLLLVSLTEGCGQIEVGGLKWHLTRDQGSIRDYALPLHAKQSNFSAFALPISKETICRHAQTLISQHADFKDIKFDSIIDYTKPGGALVRNTLHYIAETLDGPLHNNPNPLIEAQLADMLLTQLLVLLPNSLKDLMTGSGSTNVVPYYAKRAREYMHAHMDQPISMADLVIAAGCGYRTLQTVFKNTFGVSPIAYLHVLRLQRARMDFLNDADDGSVSQVARRWGFIHMSRFAQAYRQQFRELPSETLRRSS